MSGILLIPINIYDAKANPCADSTSTGTGANGGDGGDAGTEGSEALSATTYFGISGHHGGDGYPGGGDGYPGGRRWLSGVEGGDGYPGGGDGYPGGGDGYPGGGGDAGPGSGGAGGNKETVVLVVLAGLPEMLVLVQLVDQEQVY